MAAAHIQYVCILDPGHMPISASAAFFPVDWRFSVTLKIEASIDLGVFRFDQRQTIVR